MLWSIQFTLLNLLYLPSLHYQYDILPSKTKAYQMQYSEIQMEEIAVISLNQISIFLKRNMHF